MKRQIQLYEIRNGVRHHRYQNPEERCQYLAHGLDYCWSFAHHIDGTQGYEDIESICRGCDSFGESKADRTVK